MPEALDDSAVLSSRAAPREAEKWFPLAPMDAAMRLSTILVLVLLGVVSVGLVVADLWLPQVNGWLIAAGTLVALTGTAVMILIHVYSRPKGFLLSAQGMRIVWPGRSRLLPKAAFAEARSVTAMDLGRLMRRFGARGMLGCFGWFTSEYMGNMDAYVTRSDALVYLRLKNRRPLLLTPREPEAFLEALKTILKA